MQPNPEQARFLRKRLANQGVDQEQQEQQRQFGQNLEKALNTFGNRHKRKDIKQQIEYFGNMIEPFNMRQQQEMGQIDQEGFFLFKRKNQYRDAWLDSIQEANDFMAGDKLKKKIKNQGTGWRGVYDINDDTEKHVIYEKDEKNQEDSQEKDHLSDRQQQQSNPSQQQQLNPVINLEPIEIKQLLCELLPINKSANSYIKDLKKNIKQPETKQLHDKILQLCNIYIQKTNDYDILTSKREHLQLELGIEPQDNSQELNWDQDQSELKQNSKHDAKQQQKQQMNQVKNYQSQKNILKQQKNINKTAIQMNPPLCIQNEENDDIF